MVYNITYRITEPIYLEGTSLGKQKEQWRVSNSNENNLSQGTMLEDKNR